MPAKKKVEETDTKQGVTVTKDGVSYTLKDPIMVSAFQNHGYEVKE
ncbi:hypothetical protein [Streptococcus pluranimalium]